MKFDGVPAEILQEAIVHLHEELTAKDATIDRLRGFAQWVLDGYHSDSPPEWKDLAREAREVLTVG